VAKGRYLWQPYDLLALTGRLYGQADVRIIDAIAHGLSRTQVLGQALDHDPEAIVLQSGAVSWQEDLAHARELRARLPRTRIAVTGDIYLTAPRQWLDTHPELDAVLLDFTDCDVLGWLQGDPAPRGFLGRDGPRPGSTTRRRTKDFRIGVPRHEWFSPHAYDLPQARHHPFASLMTMVSCPYTCTFCPFERLPSRPRALDEVLADLDHIRNLGMKELWLKDQSFGVFRQHARALLEAMAERDFSWSCETRPDLVDSEFLEALGRAGCHTLLMGVEAADNGILSRARKGYDLATVRQAFERTRKHGMRTLAHLCLGLPGETHETLARVPALLDELDPDFLSVNLATPMVGTSFRDEAEAAGWIDPSRTMLDSSNSHPATHLPGCSAEQLWETRTRLLRQFYLRPGYALRRATDLHSVHEARTLAREGAELVRRGLTGRTQAIV
jgi:radical SAM superfamily enzyme YgiQ (UPF0313 family)